MKPLNFNYTPIESEWMTEKLLDSRELSQLIEQTLRGSLEAEQSLLRLQYVIETFHLSFIDEQRRLIKEGNEYD